MIDLDVCFFEISFSAFNRGIKNGCQQTASGPDPGSLLIKMDQRYIYIFIKKNYIFSKWLSLHAVKMCSSV